MPVLVNLTSRKNLVKLTLLAGLMLTGQIPVYSEESPVYTIKSEHDSVTVPLAGGFKFSSEQKMGGIRAIEFYLPGETLKNYTRLLSMMSTSSGDLKQSPRELMQTMIDTQKQMKETMPTLKLSAEMVESTNDNDVLIKSVNSEMNTTIFTRSVKGTDAAYQFQYQIHSATISREEEQKALATLKKFSITSNSAQPFQPIVLEKNPYEVSGKTEKLSIPVGADWKIVEDKVRERMPLFQYATGATVRTISLVPANDSLDSFAKMLKLEILPAEKAAMTPRQTMKMAADSVTALNGCSLSVIDDRSESDVTYDVSFSKPIDTMLVKIDASENISRVVTGADSQYRILMMFPTGNAEPSQKISAIALLKEIRILPL